MSVTPVLVPADLLEKEKITQESVIELTVVQHAADVPPTAIGVCVRSHALPLPVAGESYELAGRDRYRFTARQQRGQRQRSARRAEGQRARGIPKA